MYIWIDINFACVYVIIIYNYIYIRDFINAWYKNKTIFNFLNFALDHF